jgi:hypothetical protein
MTQREIDERKPYDPYEFIYKVGPDYNRRDLKKDIGFALVMAIIVFIGFLLSTLNNEEAMAVCVEEIGSKKCFKYINYEGFEVETYFDYYHKIDVGDTVWIHYSSYNDEISKVIDYEEHISK